MTQYWWQITKRVVALLLALVVIALPVFAILLVHSPLNPWSAAPPWSWSGAALRVGAALAYLCLLALLGGYAATRGARNPFDELAESIRRVATRDFQVRVPQLQAREPHELAELVDAFNAMAAELQRSEELRRQLMADVSHELRTPLTVLEGNLRAALDRVYQLDEAEIANLYGQTRHLIRLVNDLHDLSLADARQLPLTLESTDLAELIAETAQHFVPLAEERGVTLEVDAGPQPPITVDAVRIRQVLHNLLGNALRHTPRGGTIRVSVRNDGQEEVLAVADTGEGLEPEQLGAAFDRFYRAGTSRSHDTGGTGLGLAIVNALVAMHGGTVTASSAGNDKGSTFTIRLPLTPPAPRPDAERVVQAGRVSHQGVDRL